MFRRSIVMLGQAALATSCSTPSIHPSEHQPSVADIQRTGTRYRNVLHLPEFETTPAAVKATADQTLVTANAVNYGIYGNPYRHQLSFGLMDLMLNTQLTEANVQGAIPLVNEYCGRAYCS